MKSQSEHIEKMKAKLDQLDAKIDQYKAKANEANADVKIEYQKKVDNLKVERDEAKEWLNKVSDASEDAWDSLKGGFKEAYEKMKRSIS